MPADITSARTRKGIPFPWLVFLNIAAALFAVFMLVRAPEVLANYNRERLVQDHLQSLLASPEIEDSKELAWVRTFYAPREGVPAWLQPHQLA
ncbi:MAG: hypothetical protein ACR2P6_10400, partial [Gammaproteobacteria bacterium]